MRIILKIRRFVIILSLINFSSCCLISPSSNVIEVPYEALSSEKESALSESNFHEVEAISEDWWLMFEDPQLNFLMDQALLNHPSMLIAESKISEAYYLMKQTRSLLFPSLSFSGNIQRQKLSETAIPPALSLSNAPNNVTPIGAPPFNFTQYEIYLSFFYDFDLWGKNCNTLKAAIGEYQARIAETQLARLALSITLANAYFAWQVDAQLLKIMDQLVENNRKLLALTEKRVQNNLDDAFQILTIKKDLATLEARKTEVAIDLAMREHQIQAYIAGTFEEKFASIALEIAALRSFPLPQDLSLNLIAKRPDITAQLWLIESSRRLIDVANAEFYPDLNLTGLLGFNTLHLKDLIKDKSGFVLIEPAVNLPLFTGGLLEAQYNASIINYDMAVYEYDQLVLNAAQEVLDGLSALKLANEQIAYVQKEVDYEKSNYELTQARVRYGLSGDLELLTREQAILISQEHEVSSLGVALQAMLSLMKALGGGFDVCS